MTIEEIKWMTELFKTGQISKTAESLFISQPALSQCLKRIESQLGFPLFDRSNKGLVPTERGLLFRKTAEAITDSYQNFLTQAALLDQSSLRQITIGMGPYLASCCSADLMGQLSKAFPQIHFSVREDKSNDLVKALRSNAIQIVVTSGPNPDDGCVAYSFGLGLNVIFLRRGSPSARYAYTENGRRYLDPKFLEQEPIALTRRDQATRRIADKLFEETGFQPRVEHESFHLSSLYRYANEGIASSIAPLTPGEEAADRANHLIHLIPGSYQWATFHSTILVMPEIDRIMPKEIYGIIKKVVAESDTYARQI